MLRVLGNINDTIGAAQTHAKAVQFLIGIYDELYAVL
jgi:hypothetical protein